MLQYDLLLTSHGEVFPILHLIESLADQSVLPVRVIILVRKERSVIELQEFATLIHERIDALGIELIIQHAYYSDHEQGHGV